MKRHATEDVDEPDRTLCGRALPIVAGRVVTLTAVGARTVHVDNADPDCKRCLRVIEARLRKEP